VWYVGETEKWIIYIFFISSMSCAYPAQLARVVRRILLDGSMGASPKALSMNDMTIAPFNPLTALAINASESNCKACSHLWYNYYLSKQKGFLQSLEGKLPLATHHGIQMQ
jgi:hypothetical protein